MIKFILQLFILLPFVSHAQQPAYTGTYRCMNDNQLISDTICYDIKFIGDSFYIAYSLNSHTEGPAYSTYKPITNPTRELCTGNKSMNDVYVLSGTWQPDNMSIPECGIDIPYKDKYNDRIVSNKYHFNKGDGDIILLQFGKGQQVRGVFTRKVYPDLPPMLYLAYEDGKIFGNVPQ